MPLSDVGVEQCDAFRAALAIWPAHARVLPEYRGMSARAIISKAKKLNPPGLNVRTKEKHLDRLRVFFNWAVQRRWMSTNPLTGVRLQSKAQKYAPKRRDFTRDELKRLFAPGLRSEHCLREPSKFWIPVLALYTGARLRELAQLRVVDVRQIGGHWGIDITPKAGPLKNAASQRFVPLSQTALDLGMLDYVHAPKDRGFDRLFPDGSWDAKNGPGDKISKRDDTIDFADAQRRRALSDRSARSLSLRRVARGAWRVARRADARPGCTPPHGPGIWVPVAPSP